MIQCMQNTQPRGWHTASVLYVFLLFLTSKTELPEGFLGFDSSSELCLESFSHKMKQNQHSELCDKVPGEPPPSNKDSILTGVFYLTKENIFIKEDFLPLKNQSEDSTNMVAIRIEGDWGFVLY